MERGRLRRESGHVSEPFVSVKETSICRFPDPSLEDGMRGRMSRNACLHIFSLWNLSLSLWTTFEVVQSVLFRVKVSV